VLLIDGAHQSCRRGKDLIYEDEDGLLWRELNTFANNIHKLSDGQVGWHKVFLLVDGRDVRLLNLLANNLGMVLAELESRSIRATYRNAIGVFLTDAIGLGLTLLEGVLVLELAAKGGCVS
jgi:hypothetical protein